MRPVDDASDWCTAWGVSTGGTCCARGLAGAGGAAVRCSGTMLVGDSREPERISPRRWSATLGTMACSPALNSLAPTERPAKGEGVRHGCNPCFATRACGLNPFISSGATRTDLTYLRLMRVVMPMLFRCHLKAKRRMPKRTSTPCVAFAVGLAFPLKMTYNAAGTNR